MSTTTRAKYLAMGGVIGLALAWPLPIQADDTTGLSSNPIILAQAGSGDEPHPRAKQNKKAQEQKKKQQREKEKRSERKEKREGKNKKRVERKQERREDRKENKERKREQKNERKKERVQRKEERRENRQENRERKRENKAERKEHRTERKEERRDNRQENRERRRDDRADRKDDRRDERRANRERRRAGPSEGRKGREGNISEIRRQRKERREGRRVVIEEPGNRRIIREGRRSIIRHDDADRFRRNARNVDVRRRNGERITTVTRPNGVRIITIEDDRGRLLRRVRRGRDGREVVLIDNRRRHHHHRPDRRGDDMLWFLLDLAMPRVNIERRYYVVDADRASEDDLYDTLIAPPVVDIEREYSLDEVRYNYPLRARMRSVNLNTVNFAFGSWELDDEALDHLEEVARAINRALDRNPDEIFLIEGHTDAVGADEDNLTLSDRRAESVAIVLTEDFGIPPENLTTQGYGEEYLLVDTPEAERRNRRVTIRRITPLLSRNR